MEEREYELMRDFENEHWWFIGRRKIISRMIECMNLPENAEILEVGCGSGGNFEMLSEFGNIYAIESFEDAASNARNRNVAKEVRIAKLPEEVAFNDKKFDLIVFLDSLEHIKLDVASLKAVKEMLADDGNILITVPAFQMLWSGHDVACHHKRRYSDTYLSNVIKSAGYKAESSTYYNFFLFPVILMMRILGKIMNPTYKAKSDLKMPVALINRMLTKLFSLESFFIGKLKLPYGVSLMATATK